MASFQPLTNYAGYNHILQAGAVFVHPGNGNIYFCACEQQQGVHQNLSVYRLIGGIGQPELVKRYLGGGADSPSQITMGSAVIAQDGSMLVATSLVIPGAPKVTATGWQGCWIRELGADAPWSLGPDRDLIAAVNELQRIASAQQQLIEGIKTALANVAQGGLSAEDRAMLDWLRTAPR